MSEPKDPLKPSAALSSARRAQALDQSAPLSASARAERLSAPRAAEAVKPSPPSAPLSGEATKLSALEASHHAALAGLLASLDAGERDPEQTWEEVLMLALTSSLNLPKPVARQLLPELKRLAERDPELARSLKERLKLPQP